MRFIDQRQLPEVGHCTHYGAQRSSKWNAHQRQLSGERAGRMQGLGEEEIGVL